MVNLSQAQLASRSHIPVRDQEIVECVGLRFFRYITRGSEAEILSDFEDVNCLSLLFL
jgi:hypothetical protein